MIWHGRRKGEFSLEVEPISEYPRQVVLQSSDLQTITTTNINQPTYPQGALCEFPLCSAFARFTRTFAVAAAHECRYRGEAARSVLS